MSKRKFEYQDFVLKNKIEAIFDSEDKKRRRYFLSLPFSDEPKNPILVILKNPSIANKQESDNSVNRILKYIHKHLRQFDKVNITNLFVYCCSKSKYINPAIDKFGEDYVVGNKLGDKYNNDKILINEIKKASKIIVAYGNSNGIDKDLYKNRVNFIKRLLKNKDVIYINKLSKNDKHPFHAAYWSINMMYFKFKI